MTLNTPNVPSDAPTQDVAPRLMPPAAPDGSVAETLMPSTVSPTDGKGVAPPTQADAEAGAQSDAVPGYMVLEELGLGGMGVVHNARPVNAYRVVALKMILAGSHDGVAAVARDRAEEKEVDAVEANTNSRASRN